MRTMRTLFVMFLILIITAGCDKPQTKVQDKAVDVPHAWIDAPLDGSTIPLGEPYEIIFHIASLNGVTQGEVNINGEMLATLPNPLGNKSPATLRQMWTPERPGTYTLTMRAQNSAGEWSDYDTAIVIVMQNTITITPTFTPTPTLTPTITPTITPTLTPTPPPAGEITFTSKVSTSEFQYQRDCVPNPDKVKITAKLSNTSGVKYVFIFFRLESKSGVITAWNTGMMMSPGGEGDYSKTISWRDVPQLSEISGSSATFVYQFVAVDNNRNNMARSQRFYNVKLSPCK